MFFRCPDCAAHTLVKPEEMELIQEVGCGACGSTHTARDARLLGRTDREHLDKAEELAAACQIDVPAAYSVLLHIMTLKQAQAMAEGKLPAKPVAAQGEHRPNAAKGSDRNKRRAVSVTLPPPATRPRRGGRIIPVSLAALCLVLGAAVILLWQRPAAGPPAKEPQVPLRWAQIRTDGAGRPVEVRGPEPHVVLAAFCRLDRYEPVEIVVPPDGEIRYGILRDPSLPHARLAIEIRRLSQAQQWIAGDGVRRIGVKLAPSFPPDVATIPVSRMR